MLLDKVSIRFARERACVIKLGREMQRRTVATC